MKILLVQPARWNSPLSSTMVIEPLGLEVIGANLTGDHDVEILDMRWDNDLRGALERFRPDVVGATVITAEVNAATEVMRQAKEFNPGILTVMGGPQPILAPDALAGRHTDVAVTTEGEHAFNDLVRAREAGRDLRSVPGLALFEEDTMIRTAKRELIGDLSTVHLPNRKLTAPYRHRYFRGEWKPLAASFTTRGCHFRCTFCCVWVLGGAVYRTRGIDACIADLGSINEDYVFMAEDDSMFNVEYSDALADAVISSGIRKHYQFYSRSDLVVSKPELFAKWKRAGLDLLLIGMEMASDDDLDRLNKENTTDNNEKAAAICRDLGIEIISYFMVDPATFTPDHFHRLRDYIMRLGLTHPIFFIMTPLPGTSLYREEHGIVATDNLDLFDFYHCVVDTQMPLGDFYRHFIDLYRDCYKGRPEHVKAKSAFSDAVVDRFIARLEQEYEPYTRSDNPVYLRRTNKLPAPTGKKLQVINQPTLFPLKFKPGWSRPAQVR